ncbi:hypothetical protein TIFTF001_026603 [Ficus carica]|uniref:Uncharacterized protein n=1 Tax=Ficus carica TaxID=3494 RepID=A0AA88IYB0_FICCA|nr:hypothetical protein TIFTF001_026603 [Ficus carica]
MEMGGILKEEQLPV